MNHLFLPTGPVDAPVVLVVGKAIVACDPVPPYPGRFYGPPDGWEPPEPGDLGPLYLLLPSKDRWVPLDIDKAPHLEDAIWEAFDRDLGISQAEYGIEMDMEREAYGC